MKLQNKENEQAGHISSYEELVHIENAIYEQLRNVGIAKEEVQKAYSKVILYV